MSRSHTHALRRIGVVLLAIPLLSAPTPLVPTNHSVFRSLIAGKIRMSQNPKNTASQSLYDNKLLLQALAAGTTMLFYFTSQRLRAWVRTVLLAFSYMVCSFWGVIISVYYGAETNYHATKIFADTCEWTIGLKLNVKGLEYLENGPSVMVYNHQSMLDPIFLGRSMPRRSVILAKKELKWIPFFGQYLIFSKTIFLDRSNNKDSVAALKAASKRLLEQQASLLVFPEGTRSLTPQNDLLPFKKGAFHVAIEAGIPIVPVVFENQWNIYRPKTFKSGTCTIQILPPIPTKGLTSDDVTDLAVKTRETMLAAFREISKA